MRTTVGLFFRARHGLIHFLVAGFSPSVIGEPITSIAHASILEQRHYAGDWDVLRPAKELEEMYVFTAEKLNELKREAETIIEGWMKAV